MYTAGSFAVNVATCFSGLLVCVCVRYGLAILKFMQTSRFLYSAMANTCFRRALDELQRGRASAYFKVITTGYLF